MPYQNLNMFRNAESGTAGQAGVMSPKYNISAWHNLANYT